jgi:antitoxin component of MazEF toxin-antitoxin module
MNNMGKIVKLRRSGKSLVITVPKAICDMFNIKEGSQVEIEPFTSNSMQLKVK